jgi:hypothetical protein
MPMITGIPCSIVRHLRAAAPILGAAGLLVAAPLSGAGATTVLNVGDTVTASGGQVATQTLTVTSTGYNYGSNPGTISPTISYSFGNSFNGSNQLATGSNFYFSSPAANVGGPWNFQDDYIFTTSGAIAETAAISVPNAPGASLTDLQARIIPVAGNTPGPVIGPPPGGSVVDSWVSLNVGNSSFFSLGAGTLQPGTSYILQIRGEATGASGYGGAISFTPVPVPTALMLLLSGLGLFLVGLPRRPHAPV